MNNKTIIEFGFRITLRRIMEISLLSNTRPLYAVKIALKAPLS